MAQTHTHTDCGDSMTESAQWGRFSERKEKMKKFRNLACYAALATFGVSPELY